MPHLDTVIRQERSFQCESRRTFRDGPVGTRGQGEGTRCGVEVELPGMIGQIAHVERVTDDLNLCREKAHC